jgi:hypothetical protein
MRCATSTARPVAIPVLGITSGLKAIHGGEDIVAAGQKAVQVIDKLRGLRLTKAVELMETALEEALTYYAFPEEHWRRIRTNNPLERILRETAHPRGRRVPGRAVGTQSRRGQAAASGRSWVTASIAAVPSPPPSPPHFWARPAAVLCDIVSVPGNELRARFASRVGLGA